MKTIHIFIFLTAVCALLVGVAPKTVVTKAAPAVIAVDDVGAAANQELAAARRATAKYHDVQQALDDGYVQTSPCIPGEGFHYVKLPLDCQFNPEDPEGLHYIPTRNGELKLVGVEYAVPFACPGQDPPEGFSGDADEWSDDEPVPAWVLNAWIWLGNPNGVFAESHPSISCD
jgi:hypothetical protein